ncbi:MAG: hypothetical protein FWD71_10315 [Oscillospiraceae bacterium]|nr:hypothetical protein [Oscillospiraceae bacterium]
MSVYTQQINNMVEQLPESEQQLIVEFIKKISRNNKLLDIDELNLKLINQKQRETVKSVIETLNSVEPLADDELDEILNKSISLRRPEELELL